MEKKKDNWEPLPLYIPLDIPKEKEPEQKKEEIERGVIEIDMNNNSEVRL